MPSDPRICLVEEVQGCRPEPPATCSLPGKGVSFRATLKRAGNEQPGEEKEENPLYPPGINGYPDQMGGWLFLR